jgi:hypothetical protein
MVHDSLREGRQSGTGFGSVPHGRMTLLRSHLRGVWLNNPRSMDKVTIEPTQEEAKRNAEIPDRA